MWRWAALIGAALALGSWIVLCLVAQPPRLEEALRLETEEALAAAGLSGVRVSLSGRDATLEGVVPSTARKAEAERLAAGVAGIRKAESRLAVGEEPVPVPVPADHLDLATSAAGVSLRGAVPSEAYRSGLAERARQLFGAERVDDRLAVVATAQGVPLAAAAGVLGALAEAGDGVRALLSGDSLRLSGTVASAERRRRVEDRARAAAPGARLFFSTLAVSGAPADPSRPEARQAGGT